MERDDVRGFVTSFSCGTALLAMLASCGCGDQTTRPEVDLQPNAVEESREKTTQPPERLLTNSIGMKLVLIPAGEFMMGSKESAEELAKAFRMGVGYAIFFEDEYPRRRVRIPAPFYLGAYHVTVGQFKKFVADTGHKTEGEKNIPRSEAGGGGLGCRPDGVMCSGTWLEPGFAQTDEHPVVVVSWEDAVAFCEWLSRKEGKTYRLPTEAEWEYACRAGTNTRYHNGDDPEKLAEVGNVADGTLKEKWAASNPGLIKRAISAKDGYVLTAPVGRCQPNAWGLYDMHGNAKQWCADWKHPEHYVKPDVDAPRGPSSEGMRVVRGGGFEAMPEDLRSSRRSEAWACAAVYDTGFRVVRMP